MVNRMQKFELAVPMGNLEGYIHWAQQVSLLTTEEEKVLALQHLPIFSNVINLTRSIRQNHKIGLRNEGDILILVPQQDLLIDKMRNKMGVIM